MQLSHDESVFFASANGSRGASRFGIAVACFVERKKIQKFRRGARDQPGYGSAIGKDTRGVRGAKETRLCRPNHPLKSHNNGFKERR